MEKLSERFEDKIENTELDMIERIIDDSFTSVIFDLLGAEFLHTKDAGFEFEHLKQRLFDLFEEKEASLEDVFARMDELFFSDGLMGYQAVLDKIGVSFFADNQMSPLMRIDKNVGSYIGDVAEEMYLFCDAIDILLEKFITHGFEIEAIFSVVQFGSVLDSRSDFWQQVFDGNSRFRSELLRILQPKASGLRLETIESDRRMFDLLVAIFPEAIQSFHSKYSTILNTGEGPNLAADELSTLQMALLVHLKDWKQGVFGRLSIARKQESRSVWTGASDPDYDDNQVKEETWAANYGNKFRMISPELVRHLSTKLTKDKLKFPLDPTIKTVVTRKLNQLLRMYSDRYSTRDEALSLVNTYFLGTQSWLPSPDAILSIVEDIGLSNSLDIYDEIRKIFTDRKVMSEVLRESADGTCFEINWAVDIGFYFASNKELTIDDLPTDAFLLVVKDNSYVKLDLNTEKGRQAFTAMMSLNIKPTWMVVHDHGDNNRMGLIANALVNDDFRDINRMLGTDIREGYYDVSANLVHRCVPLNAPDGRTLEGRFKLVDGRLIDRGEIWFEAYRDRMVLTREYSRWQGGTVPVISLEYYRTISYSLGTRFVALLQEVNDEIVSVAPYDDHFKGSKNYRIRIDPNRFLNPDYDPESQETVEAREFFDTVKTLVDLRINVKQTPSYLLMSNSILEKINDAIGFDSLERIIKKLLSKPIPDVFPGIDAIQWDQDNFVYELFSIGLRQDKDSNYLRYIIPNIGFRGTTEKELFTKWFALLSNFESGDFSLSDEAEAKIHQVLFNNEGENILTQFENGFSAGSDYSNDDIAIVDNIVKILSYLIGRFGFLQLYRGNIFPKNGHIVFIASVWNQYYNVISKHRKIDFQLYTGRIKDTGGHTELYPGYTSYLLLPNQLKSYYLSEFFSEYTLISSKTKIEGVSNALWAPQYVSPLSIEFRDYDKLNNLLAQFIFSRASYKNPESDNSELDSLSLCYKKLQMAVLTKIKSRSKYAYVLRELGTMLHTSAGDKAIKFRLEFYEWLGARGNYPFEFKVGLQNVRIILDRKDFDAFFANYLNEFAIPLSKFRFADSSNDIAIRNINYLQDLIIDLLGFVERMAQELTQGTNKKIVLYPFTPYKNGWGISAKTGYYGISDRLESIQGLLSEWKPYGAQTTRDIGFVFDPNDPTSFEQLLPEFLGLLLVKQAGFVVRVVEDVTVINPDEDSNRQCSFIFDLFGGIIPREFKAYLDVSYNAGRHPGGLIWKDEILFLGLYQELMEILNKYNIVSVGTSSGISFSDFYALFRSPSLLASAIKYFRF
ncbi:MAG: hypothetical protein ACFFAS_00210 [Promethearchaeota archaeon]